MTPLELTSPIALTAEGVAWVLASLVAIVLFGLAHARRQRHRRELDARRRTAQRQTVRQLVADTIEDCHVAAADARRRS